MAKPVSRGEGLVALHRELGGALPAGVETLADADAAGLAVTMANAKRRQQAQVDAALRDVLGHVPMLLRGPLRKLFDA